MLSFRFCLEAVKTIHEMGESRPVPECKENDSVPAVYGSMRTLAG